VGHAESTGGLLWVVGHDPELFNYFLPERWRRTPRWCLSEKRGVFHTRTKDAELAGAALDTCRATASVVDALLAPTLAALRVGGSFSATDPESFAGALASAFKLRVGLDNVNEIVLIPL